MNKTTNEDYILELRDITKTYPGVVALNKVSFKVKRGTILSLVGENGAGKSTILKVISGVIPASKYVGDIFFNSIKTEYTNVKQSENDGIAIIHQELAISPHLSIFENIFLGHFEKKLGIINWNDMLIRSKELLRVVGLKKDPFDKAGSLSVAEQQLLEIAKALSKKAKLIIFDEPTSSLNDSDSFALLDTMKKLRDENGVTCIFVSHKLKEVEYVADAITVIRDGNHISDYDNKTSKIKEEILIKDIVGRELGSKFPPKSLKRNITDEVMLEVENLTVEHPKIKNKIVVEDSSFKVHKGEVIGISGLVGSGRTEMAMNVFGKSYGVRKNGLIKIKGTTEKLNSVNESIKKGLMYASEDRKHLGLIQIFSIHTNISMASSHVFANKLGIIDKNAELQNSRLMKGIVQIKAPSIDYNVETLSGGNQQKVLIAKALTTQFDTLIIDEPTKGIDVGSKYEIYSIIQELADQGKAIVVISSEIEELLGITDRIYVMSQGKIKGELNTKDATPEKIMSIAIGKNKGVIDTTKES